ncbi:MAG: hypothetical protein Q8K24_06525 [Hydrogenophaga sp.]|nr:hypothetical protein [Hydrogenophaga sp.]
MPLPDNGPEHSRVPVTAVTLPERRRPKVRAYIDHWSRWMQGDAAQP